MTAPTSFTWQLVQLVLWGKFISTLYEALAGRLPFPAMDGMKLVHAYITQMP